MFFTNLNQSFIEMNGRPLGIAFSPWMVNLLEFLKAWLIEQSRKIVIKKEESLMLIKLIIL